MFYGILPQSLAVLHKVYEQKGYNSRHGRHQDGLQHLAKRRVNVSANDRASMKVFTLKQQEYMQGSTVVHIKKCSCDRSLPMFPLIVCMYLLAIMAAGYT